MEKSRIISIQVPDSEVGFSVDSTILGPSDLLRVMLEDPECKEIFLSISQVSFAFILEYLQHQSSGAPPPATLRRPLKRPLIHSSMSADKIEELMRQSLLDAGVTEWEYKFLTKLTSREGEGEEEAAGIGRPLKNVLSASNYLAIIPLVHLLSAWIAVEIMKSNPDKISKIIDSIIQD